MSNEGSPDGLEFYNSQFAISEHLRCWIYKMGKGEALPSFLTPHFSLLTKVFFCEAKKIKDP